MQCCSALSTDNDSLRAAAVVARQARDGLSGPPHLAVLFASSQHLPRLGEIVETLRQWLDGALVVGCSGETIVGGGREIEQSPALALWLAELPGVRLRAMHLQFNPTRDGGSFSGWHDDLEDAWPQPSQLLLLGEPYSFPADVLLARLADDHFGLPVFGGLASGGGGPGENHLVWDDQILDSGAVAVLLDGAVRVRSVVSQGCRPIGRPLVVTKSERNMILELGGKPALTQLRELWPTLSESEQYAAQRGLHVGRVVDEYRREFGLGDFLIRNVLGADAQTGAIAIGDYVRTGQTLQFHIRDADSADAELVALLAAVRAEGAQPHGGLLFSCNGRGTRLFAQPDHDAAAIQQQFPALPLAGFFAQGEIGPIGQANYVHGFTASLALFEAA